MHVYKFAARVFWILKKKKKKKKLEFHYDRKFSSAKKNVQVKRKEEEEEEIVFKFFFFQFKMDRFFLESLKTDSRRASSTRVLRYYHKL